MVAGAARWFDRGMENRLSGGASMRVPISQISRRGRVVADAADG